MAQVSNYALRLQASMMEELKNLPMHEGNSMNQINNVADAEKLCRLRTEAYFKERAARSKTGNFWTFLNRAGNEVPREGDELPSGWSPRPAAPPPDEGTRGSSGRGRTRL
jgi:hypothetical protein